MDVALLSQTSGIFQWRIKRHLRPEIFRKLKRRILQRYSQALDISPEQLKQLPATEHTDVSSR
jgi:hypothetical protein